MDTHVPFGKYKGRPVEDMLADQDYMAWLADQPWFRQKFGHILAEKDQQTAERSPVHNSFQCLFLSETYRRAFCDASLAQERFYTLLIRRARNHRIPEWNPEFSSSVLRHSVEFEYSEKEFNPETRQTTLYTGDVLIRFIIPKEHDNYFDYEFHWNALIEIKPVIGDDYPAVMRQMKRNRSRYLFLGEYNGSGVRLADMRAMFHHSDLRVVMKSDVDSLVQSK